MGHPNLAEDKYANFIGQLDLAKADCLTADGCAMTVYVVLDIFSPQAGMKDGEDTDTTAEVYSHNDEKWTNSANTDCSGAGTDVDPVVCTGDDIAEGEDQATLTVKYNQCFSSGNKCPENFRVCDPTYCHIDKWKQMIDDLKSTTC